MNKLTLSFLMLTTAAIALPSFAIASEEEKKHHLHKYKIFQVSLNQ